MNKFVILLFICFCFSETNQIELVKKNDIVLFDGFLMTRDVFEDYETIFEEKELFEKKVVIQNELIYNLEKKNSLLVEITNYQQARVDLYSSSFKEQEKKEFFNKLRNISWFCLGGFVVGGSVWLSGKIYK